MVWRSAESWLKLLALIDIGIYTVNSTPTARGSPTFFSGIDDGSLQGQAQPATAASEGKAPRKARPATRK